MLIEGLDDLGEIGERTGETIHLVDDNRIDQPGSNVVQKLFQCWPVHVAAGESAVVVLLGNDLPAFMALAGDVGLTGFALGLKGVERLLQSFLGRLASVDGTSHAGSSSGCH